MNPWTGVRGFIFMPVPVCFPPLLCYVSVTFFLSLIT